MIIDAHPLPGGSESGSAVGGPGSPPRAGLALPCQNSHNSIEPTPKPPTLTPSARRTAFALQTNIQALATRYGLAFLGFLTLTFADHVLDPREAQRRMNSFITNVLGVRFVAFVRVFERQKSGRIHYHLLVVLDHDIRTGVDFDAFSQGDYRTASKHLRAEWAFMRRAAKLHGFGRTELLPVKSSKEAIARYLGKYIAKHLEARQPRDRGVRLVSYSGDRVATTHFAWASAGAKLWRAKVRAFVQMLHHAGAIRSPTVEAMRGKFGPRWVHHWRDCIMGMDPFADLAPSPHHLDETETSSLQRTIADLARSRQPA